MEYIIWILIGAVIGVIIAYVEEKYKQLLIRIQKIENKVNKDEV